MLLNEPSPHSTRPAAATAAAVPGTVELPAVEVDGALAPPRASAEADTVSFGAVDRNGNVSGPGSGGAARPGQDAETTSSADPEAGSGASAGSVSSTSAGADSEGAGNAGEDAGAGDGVSSGQDANADGGGRDATSTVALDVEAVKRAVAEGMSVSTTPDATSTVSLDVAAVKRATAAQAPTVAFAPVDVASVEAESAESGTVELVTEPAAEANSEPAAEADTEPADEAATGPAELVTEAAVEPGAELATESADEPADDPEPDSGGGSRADADRESASGSADLVPSGDTAPDATSAYLASTVLSTAASSVVAVPETADDVIATIHAAATAVAAADRRARQAAVFKEDPWTDLDLHRPAPPAPVGNVLDLLAPVLERPLLVVEQPGLPAAADVVALHRSELQQDFVEPPVVAAGAEPPIPPRYGPGLSVLPHIEFPV